MGPDELTPQQIYYNQIEEEITYGVSRIDGQGRMWAPTEWVFFLFNPLRNQAELRELPVPDDELYYITNGVEEREDGRFLYLAVRRVRHPCHQVQCLGLLAQTHTGRGVEVSCRTTFPKIEAQPFQFTAGGVVQQYKRRAARPARENSPGLSILMQRFRLLNKFASQSSLLACCHQKEYYCPEKTAGPAPAGNHPTFF